MPDFQIRCLGMLIWLCRPSVDTLEVTRRALVPCASSKYGRLSCLQEVPSSTTILRSDDLYPPPDSVQSDMKSCLDSIHTFGLVVKLVTCVG